MKSAAEALGRLAPEQLLAAQQQVLEQVARAAPLFETLTAISRYSEASIPTMMASILVFDETTQSLRKGGYGCLPATFAAAVDGMVPGPSTGSCGTAAFRRERVISEDVRVDPLWGAFREFAASYGIQSAWSSPILGADGRLLGVFGMYYGDCRAPTTEDLSFVDHFVHLAAVAIERHRVDADRDHQFTHDSLTGLGNRRKLEREVARLAADPTTTPRCIAIVDLDHFKMHNENLGHRAADLLLQDVGARISEAAGLGDLPIRFGGDQFVLITPANNEAMHARFSRLITSFERPFIADGLPIRLSVSAGIVEWNPHATDFETALYQAEQACIAAKQRGRDRWVAFSAEDRQLADERRRVARVLADAITAHKVFTHVQPIIDLATGAPVGFEMLARLADTPSGVIMPSVFIPIAEESSLIDSLGMSVLRSTCQLLASSGSQLDGMTANVNVSLRQLMRDGFPKAAAAAAAEHGVAPSRLCLEITESQWLDSDGPARNALLELKEIGFRLALDDFGTGYASLRLLQSVPFDVVKIDRSFTQCLGDNGAGTALCEAALRMAAACGMRVTAEGVETQEQADLLRVMGCQQGQGYWWSRPLPSADAIKWIEQRQAQPAF